MKTIFFFLIFYISANAQETIQFSLNYGVDQSDILYLHSDPENVQYHLIWKGDTVTSEWTYSNLAQVYSSLANFGLYNSFLLSSHAGDGCPTLYRIISLKNDGTWFVSDSFGNCNEFSDFKIRGFSKAEWTFPGTSVPKRKKSKVKYSIDYDKQEFNFEF